MDITAAFGLTPLADLAGGAKSTAHWLFFKLIFDFIDHEINVFRDNVLGQTLGWASGAVLMMMTAWVFFQGYRIVTGQSRESMAALVANTLRSVLIVTVATTFTFGSANLYTALTKELPEDIHALVTGSDVSPADTIDENLRLMEAAMIGIDFIAAEDPGNKDDKDQAMLMTGIGVAGPSIIGGAILLLYKISMALFIGLGPLFILALLFEQTKGMFSRWLYYGIGTMFSMSVFSFMSAVAMKMTMAVAAAFAAQYALALASHSTLPDGINSMALQQGGLGLLLSILLISAPPIAAQFFQGALGSFSHFSAFGVTGQGSVAMARTGRPEPAGITPSIQAAPERSAPPPPMMLGMATPARDELKTRERTA